MAVRRFEGLWPVRTAPGHCSLQSHRRLARYFVQSFERAPSLKGQELQIPGKQREVRQFSQRTQGDVQKTTKLTCPLLSTPFNDVRSRRIRCTTHLRRYPVQFGLGERLGKSVSDQRQTVAMLPRDKTLMRFHSDYSMRNWPAGTNQNSSDRAQQMPNRSTA